MNHLNFFVGLLIFSAVGFLIHLFLSRKNLDLHRISELVILWLLVYLGVGGLWAALGHIFFSAEVAPSIGWEPSPFEYEVGVANLAFGVLALVGLKLRGHFWTATILGFSIFLIGAAIQHIQLMLAAGDFSPGNAGFILWVNDLAVPILALAMLAIYLATGQKSKHEN